MLLSSPPSRRPSCAAASRLARRAPCSGYLDFAVRAVRTAKVTADKACVEEVFRYLVNTNVHYSVGRRWEPDGELTRVNHPSTATVYPALHHYLWLCLSGIAEAECHNLAAAFRLMCHILGVKGTMPVGHMFPWPRRVEAWSDYPPRGDRLKGRLCARFVRRSVNGVPTDRPLLFMDGNGEFNAFEGVAVYGGALYPIGEQILDRHTAPADGYSAADWNASDFYTRHGGGGLRPTTFDEDRGSMYLYFGDRVSGNGDPFQYPPWLWAPSDPNRPTSSPVLDNGTMLVWYHEFFRWEA